jgi:hypothetical protein
MESVAHEVPKKVLREPPNPLPVGKFTVTIQRIWCGWGVRDQRGAQPEREAPEGRQRLGGRTTGRSDKKILVLPGRADVA